MLLLCSCGLIDLSSFEAEAYPSAPDGILACDEHVSIKFPGPVDRLSAESIFRREGPEGTVEWDFKWESS